MKNKNVRAILLIISTFTYLLFGAAVFEKLEYRNDLEQRHRIKTIARDIRKKYNFTTELFYFLFIFLHVLLHKCK